MKFGRAIGFSMDGMQLNVTIDTKKCGTQLPFDVLEKMMEMIVSAKKQPANVE